MWPKTVATGELADPGAAKADTEGVKARVARAGAVAATGAADKVAAARAGVTVATKAEAAPATRGQIRVVTGKTSGAGRTLVMERTRAVEATPEAGEIPEVGEILEAALIHEAEATSKPTSPSERVPTTDSSKVMTRTSQ